jgi:hypothetical protein
LFEEVDEAVLFWGEDKLRINDDLGLVTLKVDPRLFISPEIAQGFQIDLDEIIIINMSYASPIYPKINVTQYQNQNSWGVRILLKGVVEYFATEYRLGTPMSELRARKNVVDQVTGKKKKNHEGKQPPKGGSSIGKGASVKNLFHSSKPDVAPEEGSLEKGGSKSKKVAEKNIELLVSMGFSRLQAHSALLDAKNNVDQAVEKLSANAERYTFNFFIELTKFISDRFLYMPEFCLACHAPHRCGGELPIICGRDLCVFFFEEHIGEKFECRLCPMEHCNDEDGVDSSLALCEALKSNGGAFGIKLSTLLEMHRHRYLPVAELLKLHDALDKANYAMKSIESILNPPLCARFERKWKEMKAKDDSVKPELAYHGTSEATVPLIMKNGLLVPGKNYGGDIGTIGHATDTGFWGKGIYLSPNASLSIGYCRGGAQLLVNAVIRGKVFKCTGLIHGAALKVGYDSHQDPSGNEWVIFDECQVLPCYAIKIGPKTANR